MEADVLLRWMKMKATQQVIQNTEESVLLVMPRPQDGYSPHYGNWAFGFMTGFRTCLTLIKNGGEIVLAEPAAPLQEDWGTHVPQTEETPTDG